MDSIVQWHGRMSFTGHSESGFSVNLDSDPAVGGDNKGFRPLELMAISLGGCTAMDVISILNKMRQAVHDFQVKVHVERAEQHPRVFTSGIIEYHISGNSIDEESVIKAIRLSRDRYCPAQAMLLKVFPITLKYYIYEGQGEERQLTKQGEV
jgi:putative redox protein